MARVCIFCGNAPVTKEHAWPQWLCERFKGQRFSVTDVNGRTRETAGVDFSIRVVCAACNNGWMSELEVAARATIESLVEGKPLTFDETNRYPFIAWCIKTVMVMEQPLSRSSGVYYTQEERSNFSKPPHAPPTETMLSVAHYTGVSLRAGFRGSEIGVKSLSGDRWAPARRFSIVFGQMAVRVESNRWQETTGNGFLQWPDSLWGKAIHPWPLGFGPQGWPHVEKLTDAEVREQW